MALKKIATPALADAVLTTDFGNIAGTQYTFAAGTGVAIDFSGRSIDGLAAATTANQPATYQQLLDVVAGNKNKESLLTSSQLSTGPVGVLPAFGLYCVSDPADLSVLTIDTDTQAPVSLAEGTDWNNDGGTAALAMASLADAINIEGTFSAAYHADLDSFNSPDGIIVIMDVVESDKLRAWLPTGTASEWRIVSFNSTTATGPAGTVSGEYSAADATVFQIGTTDPTVSEYSGVSYAKAALLEGQTHWASSENSRHTWDDDAETWNQTSSISIPNATSGSGVAGIKGIASYDSDLGLAVTLGVARVKIAALNAGSIEFDGSGNVQAKIDGDSVTRVAADGSLQVGYVVPTPAFETITISSPQNTANEVTLANAALNPASVTLQPEDPAGFLYAHQVNGDQFTVGDDGAGNVILSWDNTKTYTISGAQPASGMVGDLAATWKLHIHYERAAFTPAA